jgi:SH3-like domain-containing protein
VSSDLFRALRWVVPAIAVASLMFWTLATAEPIESPSTDPATWKSPAPSPNAPFPRLPAPTAPNPPTTPTAAAAPPAPERRGPVTGFALPRFVSMGASEGNARRGPSRSHRIDWVFTRRGMPVMIVAEHGHWRRVVDRDGVGGWMHYSLLSGVRTAIVEEDMLALYSRPDASSPVRARAELGVIGRLRECRPDWCLMETGGYRGWVDPRALWGVEPGEVFD